MKFSTRQSIAFSIAARYCSLLAHFGSTMILARLLTPEDIGIYSAGFSVVALAHLFRDFGLNQYLIQERELDADKISAAFTLTIIISWALGGLVFLAGGPAARFFEQPDIAPLLRLLSISFFLIPFGSVTLALLRKALKFQITSSIAVAATIVGIIVSVATALQGARYFCLAYGAIAESLTTVALSLLFRQRNSIFRLSLKGAMPILRFGSIVGVGNIIHRLSISGTDALIARFLGMTALGFFSRAHGTFSLFGRLFTGSISSVILPLFSRDNHDMAAMSRGYLKALNYSIVFAWPFFSFLYLFTDEVVLLLYGDQWGASVPLVKVLCASGMLLPPILFSDNLFIALGRPEVTLRIRATANLTKLALVALACQYDLEAVCLSLVGFHVLKLAITLTYLRLILGVGPGPILAAALGALPCLAGAILPAAALGFWLLPDSLPLLPEMLIIGGATAFGWLGGLLLSRHPFTEEIYAVAAKLPGLRVALRPRRIQ